jgi:arylsulfatase A-like enzyme/Tfp pilus assembly protein PilF
VVLAALVVLVSAALLLRPRPSPNLLLITIDTLRADHVGAYGDKEAETPVLDALAARGTRFARALSAAPLTGPSHATILTGTYPPSHGVRDNATFVLGSSHPTLATILKGRGYQTAGVVAGLPLVSAFGFSQGFESYDEAFHESAGPTGDVKRPGGEVADAVVRILEGHPKAPFFVWAHFYDPHAPYAPPSPYKERFATRPYDGEIAFVDAQVGRVLEALRASGALEQTVVAVTADHGEGLGEHDEITHAVLVYQSTLRVPWILAGPGVPGGKVVEGNAGTVDLVPTLLGLLGVPRPPGLAGRDLVPALRGEGPKEAPLYAESLFGRLNCGWAALRVLTDGSNKLIQGAEPELYDLDRDPAERENVAAAHPEVVARLRRELAAALEAMAPQGDEARPRKLSAEQEERLRSLGYASAGGPGAGALDAPGLPDPRTHVGLYDRLQVDLLSQGPAAPRALEDAVRIADSDETSLLAHFTVASLAYRIGALSLAEKAYARAVALDPETPSIRVSYGRLLRDLGKLEASERQLRAAVAETTEDDAATGASLAMTLVLEGKVDEAGTLLEPLLKTQPRHVGLHEAMGLRLARGGRPSEAIAHLEMAAEGGDPEARIELGEAQLDLGHAREARAAAEVVLKGSPGHPWALALLGRALVLEGRKDEGLRVLRTAASLRPPRPRVWLALASGFDQAGDAPDAAACRKAAETIQSS